MDTAELVDPADFSDYVREHIGLRRGKLRVDAIVSQLPVIVRVIGRDGTYLLSEGQGLKLIGRVPGDRVGESVFEVQRQRPDILAEIRRALDGEQVHFICDLNGYIWESHYTPLYDEGEFVGTLYVAMDISARARAEAALRESEARLHDLLDHAGELIQVLDADGRFVYVNRAWRESLGYDPDAIAGLTIADVVAPDAWPVFRALLERLRGGESGGVVATVLIARDGRRVAVEGDLGRGMGDGQPGHLRGIFRDVTRQRELEAHLLYQATHDALTGVPNRVLFMQRLEEALARSAPTDGRVAALFIDLDGFKPVNDRLGHAVGDVVLTVTARRLRDSVGPEATVGRIGGDEFAVFIEGCTDPGAPLAFAERIAASLARPIAVGDDVARISASIGIALHGASRTHADELLGAADAAMYRAKRGSGARIVVA